MKSIKLMIGVPSLLLIGWLLIHPRRAGAQTPVAGAADLVGTWELTGAPAWRLKEYLTIRPSGLWLHTRIDTTYGGVSAKGDTLACTEQASDQPGVSESARLGWYRLKGQELHENSGWPSDNVYKRVDDLSTGPLSRLVATGYGLGHAAPAHAPRATGTLADFAGTWQTDSVRHIGKMFELGGAKGTFRSVVVIHPDSTLLIVRLQHVSKGRDTLTVACGDVQSLSAWKRHGDSLYITPPGPGARGFPYDYGANVSLLLLRNGQLDLYAQTNGKTEPFLYESYKPIELPKQP